MEGGALDVTPSFVEQEDFSSLMGMNVDEAEEFIKSKRPDLKIERMPPGKPVTRDCKPTRVRLFHDENGKIIKVPCIG